MLITLHRRQGIYSNDFICVQVLDESGKFEGMRFSMFAHYEKIFMRTDKIICATAYGSHDKFQFYRKLNKHFLSDSLQYRNTKIW